MVKTKKKLTKEEKLAKDRLRKRQKYEEIKNNPDLYKVQKEKNRMRYLLKKEKKKVLSIKDMSARAQREQRKRWRKNSLNYLKKKEKEKQKELETILIENTPLESENITEHVSEVPDPDPLTLQVKPNFIPQENLQIRRKSETAPSCSIRKFRYRATKTINRLQTEIDKLKKEKDVLRKKNNQLQETLKKNTLEDTLEKKVNTIIKDIKNGKVNEVKKKLLFDETLSRGLNTKYMTLKKAEKRSFAQDILQNKARLAKYKLISKIPFTVRKKLTVEQKTQINKKIRIIQAFFEDDANSRMASGKKEFVKRGNVKKQKRYLNDNLKNLHNKYCKEQGMVSYSVFCRYRPYWVVFPKEERDTCQCKLHANVNFLIKALKKSKIIWEGSTTHVLNSLCCYRYEINCLARSCKQCKEKTLNYKEFDNSTDIKYFEWILEKQNYRGKDGQQKVKTVTTKKTKEDKPRNIIKKLESIMKLFFEHARNIVMQYSEIKTLKENLGDTEVLLHVDFSENYCFKYHEEIQSYNFGGSRGQVSLHTVIMYYIDSEKGLSTKLICTMSENVTHDASAIWAHIIPVLNTAKQLVPSLSKVHFLSDSPSSQYRNRFIFYMITKINQQVPTITTVTWNYQEAGHGKGAPDGVGAVVKRTADNHVKFGGDVGSFKDFVDLIREKVQSVEIFVIAEEDIYRKKFPASVPAFKGTTKVHQVLWSSNLPYTVAFRYLSCFSCLNSYLPCKHEKHLGVLSVGLGQTTATNNLHVDLNQENLSHLQFDSTTICDRQTNSLEMDVGVDCQLTIKNNLNDENNLFSTLDIDSDTLYNNIGNNTLLDEFDGTLFLNESINSQPVPAKKKETEPPKILSNIIFDYQSFCAQKYQMNGSKAGHKQKFDHQQEYEKFLQSTKVHRINIDETSQKNAEELCLEEGYQSIMSVDIDEDINKENIMTVDDVDLQYNLDDWVIVKYKITKNRPYFVYYVGKIMDKVHNTREYKVGFLKKSRGITTKFGWPSISDEDLVTESRIVQRLSEPQESRRGQFSFDDLPNFNYK